MIGTVIYNRTSRKWEVYRKGSVVASFPAGEDGHYAALEHQIALGDGGILPPIQHAMKRYPELRGRLIKGAQLLIDGHIARLGGDYLIRSQNGNGTYLVEINANGDWQCQCQDFEWGLISNNGGAPWQGGGPKCKHILAVMLLIKLSQRDPVPQGSQGKGNGDDKCPRSSQTG